jgi:putative ABC transport system permease protein
MTPSVPPPQPRSWPLARLAMQNLLRRRGRTAALAVTVAVAVAAVFSTLVLRQAMHDSMNLGLSRMGADLIVVPRDTLVNLTTALLTVEPSPHTLDARMLEELARLPGVERVAPQRHFRVPSPGAGHVHEIDVVVFDPDRDFTVLPWLRDKLERPLRSTGVLVGGRRPETPGDRISILGRTFEVHGRLDLTGVGPFDRACFVTFDAPLELPPDRVSAFLIRLAVGATPEQARFAIARMPGVKVVSGASLFTSVRQALSAILGSVVVFSLLILLATVLMVSVLYSAMLAERRRELGLLLALGARRRQLVRTILTEAVLTTALGGVGGVLLGAGLLVLFQRSLGYHFESAGIPFLWPGTAALVGYAAGCVLLGSVVGWLGALVPAWRCSREEPYLLIRAEGG